ncbi:MAG: hypothetical protein K8F92_04025 [Hyphomicrobium sp.]|uniref:hypothetical protein n=1 Tax=Hyphomicrobium sp. TaxID=82 RepID=UPI001321159B|nr:hypothetical protein [Hyphomicrobium sp.]KAB2940334.1 MAG: hypothetical protein F9K20_13900 [Hyphomicrobium sp.]MBZ0208806.1 hypothetical protein [Hyphomicrobium sp.]
MAAQKNGKANHGAGGSGILLSNDPEAFEAEFAERMLASAAGLPRVCVLNKCRRRKRCFGPLIGGDLPCKRLHRGLARARFKRALKVLGLAHLNEDGTPTKRQ